MRASQPAAVVAALVLVFGATACGTSSPGALDDLLEVMPASAASRGLFYSDLRADVGFGTALPLRAAEEVLGVAPADVDEVLETGGSPLTVLSGAIRASRVAEAVERQGYRVSERDGWTYFSRADADVGGPLAAAVPAGAARRGLLVLGASDEVQAAIGGVEPASVTEGVDELLHAMGDLHAAAVLISPDHITEAAAAEGGVAAALARADASGDLPSWRAAALTWHEPDDAGEDGAVLLALGEQADGHEAARALVLRAATTPLLGEGRRATTDLFERGPPRWDPDLGVVRMPVRWVQADPAAVRADVERGSLLFLAPSGDT